MSSTKLVTVPRYLYTQMFANQTQYLERIVSLLLYTQTELILINSL